MGVSAATQQAAAGTWTRFLLDGAGRLRRLFGRLRMAPPQGAGNPGAAGLGTPPAAAPLPEPVLELQAGRIMADLKQTAAALTEVCARTESDFLGLGQALGTIHGDAQALTRHVMGLLAADQEQSIQSAIEAIQADAAQALSELSRRRAQLSEDLAGLGTIHADLASLHLHNGSFKQVAKNLKMVGLNTSIESARSELAKANFQALAVEITELAQTVYGVAGNIRDDAGEAQKTMDTIQAEIGSRMRHLDGLIGTAQSTVNTSLSEVDKFTRLTMTVLDGIGLKAKEIGDQVGRLVVGIQIHDNITQRVAHIRQAMEEAVDLIHTSTIIPLPPAALNAIYGKVYGINRIQITHLQTILDDVTDTRNKCVRALEALAAAVLSVAQPEGLDLSDSVGGRSARNGHNYHPVAVLQRALGQLLSLFDEGNLHLQRLQAARELTARTIAEMDRHIEKVREINFEIRLKALNAVVKSTHLGDTGKAIEAIVNEMKALAEQSNATIQSVTGIMEEISSASQNMDRQGRSEEAGSDSAGERLRAGIDRFTEASTHFKAQSQCALDMGRHLQEKIDQTRHRIDFFDRLLEVSQRHFAGLTRMKQQLQPFAEAVNDEWMAEEKNILARYTMQRERDAHLQAFHGSPAAGIETALRPSDEARPEETLDDNVELF
jgi:methyl-accepting chemotaxis protein